MSTAVVYVHGLWMIGIEGSLLRRRLGKSLAASTPFFHYRSVVASLDANAEALRSKLSGLDAEIVHLVGHSLGGLVILKMFECSSTQLAPGRVVLLGSPVGGSRAAKVFASLRMGTRLLGRTVAETLLIPSVPRWNHVRELGVIAGDLNFGLGRVVNTHQAPSDGTVFVDETRITGAKEHIVLRVSHTGLPLSRVVAEKTSQFLAKGSFRG